MGNYKKSFDLIIAPREGMYSNNSADRGKETVWGLTKKDDADWEGWAVVDKQRLLPNFPGNLINTDLYNSSYLYYKRKYWDCLKLDQINNDNICTELFDISVVQGQPTAAKYLQRALNLLNRNGKRYPDTTVDGIVGSQTVSLVNSNPYPQDILLLLNVFQGYRYITICEKDKTQEEFMVGWLKRVSLP